MKTLLFIIVLFSTTYYSYSQVMVNGNDVNENASTIEVWAFKKPFSNKEVFFVDYGQDKFRPHYYDHKTQCINDKEGNKFERGEWIKLLNYLKAEGWSVSSERNSSIGDQEGRIITFTK